VRVSARRTLKNRSPIRAITSLAGLDRGLSDTVFVSFSSKFLVFPCIRLILHLYNFAQPAQGSEDCGKSPSFDEPSQVRMTKQLMLEPSDISYIDLQFSALTAPNNLLGVLHRRCRQVPTIH